MTRLRAIARSFLSLFVDHKDEFTNLKLRRKFRELGVDVGLYSYGCFDINRIPPGVTVGRYSSFAPSARIFLRNHGLTYLGLTPYFYNSYLGMIDEDTLKPVTMAVSDDVWVGHNAILLPGVKTVGRGAVIAAGAVVTKPVPPYAVVAGNPARVVKMRFDVDMIAKIESTRWWEYDTEQVKSMLMKYPDLVYRPNSFFADRETFTFDHQ